MVQLDTEDELPFTFKIGTRRTMFATLQSEMMLKIPVKAIAFCTWELEINTIKVTMCYWHCRLLFLQYSRMKRSRCSWPPAPRLIATAGSNGCTLPATSACRCSCSTCANSWLPAPDATRSTIPSPAFCPSSSRVGMQNKYENDIKVACVHVLYHLYSYKIKRKK